MPFFPLFRLFKVLRNGNFTVLLSLVTSGKHLPSRGRRIFQFWMFTAVAILDHNSTNLWYNCFIQAVYHEQKGGVMA